MPNDKRMGQKIRALREERELSLRDAGTQLDMDYSYLGRIERGFIPSMKVIQSIANFYEVDISVLIGSEMEIPELLKPHIQKWYSVIKESEDRGYTPEDISKILDTLDAIKGNNMKNEPNE